MLIKIGHGSPGSPTATIEKILAYELEAGPYEQFLNHTSLALPTPQLMNFLDLLTDDLTEIQETDSQVEEYTECITLGFTNEVQAYGSIAIYLLHQLEDDFDNSDYENNLAAHFQLVVYFAQNPVFMPLLNSESSHQLRAESYEDQNTGRLNYNLFDHNPHFFKPPESLAFLATLQIFKPDETIITNTFSSHPGTFPLIKKPFAQMLAGSVTHHDNYCPRLLSSKTEMPYQHYLVDPAKRSKYVDQLLATIVPYSINVEPQVALMWLGEVLGV